MMFVFIPPEKFCKPSVVKEDREWLKNNDTLACNSCLTILFHNIFTSSVIYYWTATRQYGIYLLNGAKYLSNNAFRDKKSFVALLFHTVYSMSLVQFTVSGLSSNVIGRWIPHFSIMCDLPLLPFFLDLGWRVSVISKICQVLTLVRT